MNIRIILAAASFAMLAQPASSQVSSAMPVPPASGHKPVKDMVVEGDLVRVALDTAKGRIVLELDQGKAPITVANFLAYLDKGWLDGQPFYRAMPYGDGGLIQGGVRDGGKQLPSIRTEPTDETGLKNVAGTIAMANGGPNTTRSDFFIMTTDIPAFDGPGGFAAFGRVVDGMEVVKAILASPTSPTLGDGVMKGQMLDPVVNIEKATRVKR